VVTEYLIIYHVTDVDLPIMLNAKDKSMVAIISGIIWSRQQIWLIMAQLHCPRNKKRPSILWI